MKTIHKAILICLLFSASLYSAIEPRISIVTLGAKNIEESRKFYEQGLGWKVSSVSNESFVAFHTQGVIFCLYDEKLFAEDVLSRASESGFRSITLSYNVGSKEEVDELLRQVVEAGAKLVKPAEDVFWGGYIGYFADVDDHIWEIGYNPYWPIREDGTLQLPE